MHVTVLSLISAAVLFVGMIALGELGRRLALRRSNGGDPEAGSAGLGVVDGAVFGLLGLIVAFSFAGAVTRFDTQRELVVEEAITIGSTYQFLDLLPVQAQAKLRETFRRYLDSRIEVYRLLPDLAAAASELKTSRNLENEIWAQAVEVTRGSEPGTLLLLPAINEMFDIATKRTVSVVMHPPPVIFVLMFTLALTSALLAGYGMANPKSRDWLRLLGFASIASIAFYVILDIEFPRSGLVQIDSFDRALVQLRASMH